MISQLFSKWAEIWFEQELIHGLVSWENNLETWSLAPTILGFPGESVEHIVRVRTYNICD